MAKKRRTITFSPAGVTASQGNVSTTVKPTSVGANVGTQQGDITYGAGVSFGTSGPQATVGAQGQSGNVGYNAGLTASGAGIKPAAGVVYGDREGNTDYNAGISTNSGASAGVGTQQGNVRYGVNASTVSGTTGSVQFGQGQGSSTGAQVGGQYGGMVGSYFGPVGTFVGSGIGSAAGSLVGSRFNGGSERKEHNVRNSVISSLDSAGMWDPKTRLATNPDGSTFDFSNTGRGGEHTWADPTRRSSDHTNTNQLFSYETDYTNDLDYTSYMVGNSLARLLGGGTSKGIDQFGAQLGNAFLGNSGYGAKMDEKTFANTMANARAYYAKMGISTKEDMLGLANSLFSQGKIKDEDYAVMQQSAGFVFDNDYNTASKLMAGRDKGIAEAGKTPADSMGAATTKRELTAKERKYGRIITPEEAWAATKPFFDLYRQEYGIPKGGVNSNRTTLNQVIGGVSAGIGAVRAGVGLYNAIDKWRERNNEDLGGVNSGTSVSDDAAMIENNDSVNPALEQDAYDFMGSGSAEQDMQDYNLDWIDSDYSAGF